MNLTRKLLNSVGWVVLIAASRDIVAQKPIGLVPQKELWTSDPSGSCPRNNVEVLSASSGTTFLCQAGTWTAAAGGGLTSPLTTKGDVWSFSAVNARLAVGANGQAIVADSTQALGVRWGNVSGSSPLTTKGDLWGFSSVDARLPVGANGQALLADSTQTLGVRWGTNAAAINFQVDATPVSGGAVSTVNVITAVGITPSVTISGGIASMSFAADTSLIPTKLNLQSATNPQICTSASGSGSAYTAACATTLTAYATKQTLFWFADFLSSTTTPTLNIDALGAKTVVKNDGTALTSGDIKANVLYRIWYDGTNIRCVEAGLGGSVGGVTSFTGDGALISNSGSTGAVTAVLATFAAHKFYGNNTGSTATPGPQTIGLSDLPATVATTVANTFTGQQIVSLNGAASTPPAILTGTWFSGGSATTTKPQFLVEPTGTASTAWSTAGTGIGVNAPSGFTGNILDLQIAGVEKLTVLDAGGITWIQAPVSNYLAIGNHTVLAAAPSLYLQGTGRIDVVSAGAGVHIQGAVLTAESGFISLPTASDPGCSGGGDLGRQWMDSTSSVTTHFKVCANVSSSPAWVQVF